MNNIIFIVGLPGSGKSNFANRLNKDNDNKYRIINDPKSFDEILRYIHEDLIITDPSLCFENNRKLAEQKISENNPNAKIDWIFFENNPEACLRNSDIRNRALRIRLKPEKRVSSFIKNFSKFYTIPDGATRVKVFNSFL